MLKRSKASSIVASFRRGDITIICYEAYPDEDAPKLADGRVDWPRVTDSGHYSVVVTVSTARRPIRFHDTRHTTPALARPANTAGATSAPVARPGAVGSRRSLLCRPS
jgi:hypothetical protein